MSRDNEEPFRMEVQLFDLEVVEGAILIDLHGVLAQTVRHQQFPPEVRTYRRWTRSPTAIG